MALPFQDSFGGTLANWTQISGAWSISGGKLTQTSTSDSQIVWTAAPGVADVSVQANLYRDGTDNKTVGLLARWSGASGGSGYLGCIRTVAAGADQWQIFKCVAGIFTQIGASTAEEFVDGSLARLSVQGSAVKLQMWSGSNWVDKVSVTDGTFAAAGQVGLRANYNGSPYFDNFLADSIPPSVVPAGLLAPLLFFGGEEA